MDYEFIRNHLVTYSEALDQRVYAGGQGACFVDEAGNSCINMNDISFILGYNHPGFMQAMAQAVQTRQMGHFGILSDEKELLIRNFWEVTHGDFDKIAIAASGGEVVDWSIKAARRYTGRDGIISFRHALHGRSFAGAWLSDTPTRKDGFGTGLEHTWFWDSPEDGRPCEPRAEEFTDAAAIILEPYQAIGGMGSPSPEYWQWLRRFTREHGIVLILDEIQTGFGKTGSFFAYQQAGIVPDILLAGKGMSNGFGLGAMLMSREVGSALRPHEMSGGSADNDFMCSMVNAVFRILQEENIPEHAREMGQLLKQELSGLGAVRGEGLFLSLELPEGTLRQAITAARERGVALGGAGNRLLLRPPLVITREQVLQVCRVLQEIVPTLNR